MHYVTGTLIAAAAPQFSPGTAEALVGLQHMGLARHRPTFLRAIRPRDRSTY